MTGSARCVHIDLEGLLPKGRRLPYRAHIKLSGDRSLIDETVEDLVADFGQNGRSQLGEQAWSEMTSADERPLIKKQAEEVLSAYLMKRVRGESIDEAASLPCSLGGPRNESRRERPA